MEVSFAPACGALSSAIYWGVGPVSAALTWTNSVCVPGTEGTANYDPGPLPPGGWIYFVVVGQNLAKEGSYGKDSSGNERPEAVGVGACDRPQDLTGTCP